MHTDDQDEIDLFLYDYYKKEVPQRFVYLAQFAAPKIGALVNEELKKINADYNNTFGLYNEENPNYSSPSPSAAPEQLIMMFMTLNNTGIAIPP